MRRVLAALLVVLIVAQPKTISASSMGLDSLYRTNMTSSSRDSGVYVPRQPAFLYPQAVDESVAMAEADVLVAQDVDEENYSLIEGLSIDGQRMVESLFFRAGTVDIDSYYTKPLNARPDIMTVEKLTQYDGSYLKLNVGDFSRGIRLSKLFNTDVGGDNNNLDILEMNKGLHGYELGFVRGTGMSDYEFVVIPRVKNPGNIELLLNDTILIVIGTDIEVSPLKFSSNVDISFSSLDEVGVYEYDGDSGEMVQTSNELPDIWDIGAGIGGNTDEMIGYPTENLNIPVEYAGKLKAGGAEKYAEYIRNGATPDTAMGILEDQGFLLSTDDESAQAEERADDEYKQSSASDVDKFFQDAGLTNKLDELADMQNSANSVMQNSDDAVPSTASGTVAPSQAEKQLDTSKIDLDPMTWGVSIQDGTSYGVVTTDGDQLLADWSDEMVINITSLTGAAHEFVQKTAVRPKPITHIQPTPKKVLQTSPVFALTLLAAGGGILFLYIVVLNSYVMKVRKKIKMAEIESLKSYGGTIIGDLESFEIS